MVCVLLSEAAGRVVYEPSDVQHESRDEPGMLHLRQHRVYTL
jgi:hypothetical protein